MSGKGFNRINECLKLDHEEEAPEHGDMLFWIRKMKKGFNDNIHTEFNPSWLVCTHEIIVAFYIAHSSGCMGLDRKHHPFVNEHHSIACCETKVSFSMELVEGKYKSLEGTNASPECGGETGSTIASLCLRMTKLIWGSGRGYILDSGFGCVPIL